MEEGRVQPSLDLTPESDGSAKANGKYTIESSEDEEVFEWREGRHLVREYHSKAPGEEVRDFPYT